MAKLSEKAREIRNAYHREYMRKHPEKRAQYQKASWERKAREIFGEDEKGGKDNER